MAKKDFAENQFITVAGRAGSSEEFAALVKKNLFDNYEVVAVHNLGEFGIDDKERFLAFVTGDSASGKTFGAQQEKLRLEHFGAHVHNNLEEAYYYSKENYPAFGEKEQEIQEKIRELHEKFPAVRAAEIEQFHILEAMWANGRVSFVRALHDDEPCVVLIALTPGADELRIRPLAIMMNDTIEALLEFPGGEE